MQEIENKDLELTQVGINIKSQLSNSAFLKQIKFEQQKGEITPKETKTQKIPKSDIQPSQSCKESTRKIQKNPFSKRIAESAINDIGFKKFISNN